MPKRQKFEIKWDFEVANRTDRFLSDLSNQVNKCRFKIKTFKVSIADYGTIKK